MCIGDTYCLTGYCPIDKYLKISILNEAFLCFVKFYVHVAKWNVKMLCDRCGFVLSNIDTITQKKYTHLFFSPRVLQIKI